MKKENMFEKFYERYDSEEKEVIALIQRTLGAGYNNGFWDMAVISLGMVFCDTGKATFGRDAWSGPSQRKKKTAKKVGTDSLENKYAVSRFGNF